MTKSVMTKSVMTKSVMTKSVITQVAACLQGALLAGGILLASSCQAFAQSAEQAPQPESLEVSAAAAEKFAAMSRLAGRTQIFVLQGDAEIPAVLRPEPLIKYGDETRNIKESTVWVWTHDSVPVAFQKIEVNVWNGPEHPFWTFCMASLSEHRLKFSWPFRSEPFFSDPVSFQPLPGDAALPSADALLQLKLRSEARRFSIFETHGKQTFETRLLPQPMMQFSSSKSMQKGAVFGFAIGTNPDVQLILRGVPAGEQALRGEYGMARMTSFGVSLNYQNEQLVSLKGESPGDHGTWGYFFARAGVSD
jgi:hypothetical protein